MTIYKFILQIENINGQKRINLDFLTFWKCEDENIGRISRGKKRRERKRKRKDYKTFNVKNY